MKKRIIAFILIICIATTFCVQPAAAMGPEGIIIGEIALTMPQVAILIAAGFGLVYSMTHAEEIAYGLNNALNNAANNVSNGVEQLTYWNEQAAKGAIAIASAPSWIAEAIKTWVTELYNTTSYTPLSYGVYQAGEAFPTVDFWNETTMTGENITVIPSNPNNDCIVIRSGSISITDDGGFYSLICKMLVIKEGVILGHNGTVHLGDVTYSCKAYTWATNPQVGELNEYNQKAYDAILTLPNMYEIKDMYPEIDNTNHAMLQAWADGYFENGSVCPDAIVGGIDDAIGSHGIDSIKVPDLDIGGSELLTPGNVADGSIDDVLDNTLTGLKQQEISWEQYMNDVAVGVPTVAIPQEGNPPLDFPITDTGVSDIPIDTTIPSNPSIPGNPSVEVPEGLAPFTISLSDLFPFCIPFDIADFVNVLCAEPEAPSFEWAFPTLDGTTYKMEIDLSPFDTVAQLLRNMELLLFCIGLALMTRNQIRG